jgi:hypothetical protein
MARKLYIVFGVLVIGGYLYAGIRGLELSQPRRGTAPAGARGTHGGWSVWYSGHHGGK